MQWIGAIIAIGVLIIVHEAGHFFVARWCKMRVDRFSVGFGPAIWSKKYKGTIFQVAPIPFGGFVQINGMLVADDVDADDPNSYPNRPAWQRFLTIFAGPATNYLFAMFLALILFTIAGVQTGTAWYKVSSVDPALGAAGKLEPGDRLLRVQQQKGGALVLDEPIYFKRDGKLQKDLAAHIQEFGDAPFLLVVERDGKVMPPIEVAAKKVTEGDKEVYRLGVSQEWESERRDVGVLGSVGHALYYPIDQTKVIVTGLYKVITGEVDGALTGPVGITSVIKQSISAGWITMLELLMLLNVYLGLFNLFPLPALDGGRLVFLSYEMATRRRANPKVEATVHMVGIMALLVIMVLVTYKDIARLL
ncbi:MAG TPA: site-2 protease family protein [Kofleriaceae bacterium]|nr:site-2 protease family protein [Kofleriaceae bacterium]